MEDQQLNTVQSLNISDLLTHVKNQEEKNFINYENLEQLAISEYSEQIQILNIAVPNNLEFLDDLRFICPSYFQNIKRVNVFFVDEEKKDYEEEKNNNNIVKIAKEKEIRISEPLFVRGLNIYSKTHKISLKITGEFDVKITDSKFNRIMLWTHQNRNVIIKNTQFLNSSFYGFESLNCNMLILDNIICKDCMWGGCHIENVQNVAINDLNISVFYGTGCTLKNIFNFEIVNACIKNCTKGFHFQQSTGEIKNIIIQKCVQFGIVLKNSTVSHKQVQFVNVQGSEVYCDKSVFEKEE